LEEKTNNNILEQQQLLKITMTKRPSSGDDGQLALYKRTKSGTQSLEVTEMQQDEDAPKRFSSLKEPLMLLTGHEAGILTCKFHPHGDTLASAGHDRSIFLWKVHDDCKNYATLKNAHANSITDLVYSSDGSRLFSCSADKTVIIWDNQTGVRIKKLKEHYAIVNALSVPIEDPNLLASVGDDNQIIIWDVRKRKYAFLHEDNYPLTSVAFTKNGHSVVCGGIENVLKVWDLRKDAMIYGMRGHTDTVTGLALSPDGNYVLSNSMDRTLKVWDVRPFAPDNRLLTSYVGHQHSFEKNLLRCNWSCDGKMVSAGSSDRSVYIWDTRSCQILYKLPGHQGSVNEVVFHPSEPIVLSCSSDKQLYMGEIEPLSH
ncbi:U5 small nuclear ribonucleoprotein 40 kDa protein, partial [Fragariocoptes setiger]